MDNCLQLVASVIERNAMRFTPAGIPIINATLKHHSRQIEAEIERTIEFEVPVIAIGKITDKFQKLEIGQIHQFSGFLARKNQKSKSLVFHITDITSITDLK